MRETLDFFLAHPASPLFNDGQRRQPRQAQAEYAREVLAGLEAGIGLIEGATGAGKTVGYLAAAILRAASTGSKIFVSTQTIELQHQAEQTMAWLAPMMEQLTGRAFSHAVRVGRRNFLDLERLQKFIRSYGSQIDREALETLRIVETWMIEAPGPHMRQGMEAMLETHDRSFPFDPAIMAIPNSQQSHAYDEMVAAARAADVVIVNHALLCLNTLLGDRILQLRGSEEQPPAIVIADEADHLNETMKSLMSERVNFKMMAAQLPEGAPEAGRVHRIAESLALSAETLRTLHEEKDLPLSRLQDSTAIRIKDSLRQGQAMTALLFMDMAADLDELIRMLDGYKDSHHEGAIELHVSLTSLRNALAAELNPDAGSARNTFLYWTPSRGEPGLALEPENSRSVLSRLWQGSNAPELIYTSATMTRHSGSRIMSDFGPETGLSRTVLEQAHCARVSPDEFGTMSFVLIDPADTPLPVLTRDLLDGEEIPPLNEWHARANLRMIRQAHAEGGRVLVLVPSYRDNHLYQRLITGEAEFAGLDGAAIFSARRSRRGARKAFQEGERSILFAPDAWVGLDLPGMIQHIVIPRIPLQPPSTAANHALESYLRDRGVASQSRIDASRYSAMLSKAVRKLTQGFGRGVRTASDDVKIWIGDPRWGYPKSMHAPHRRTWSSMMPSAVPERFQPALQDARIYCSDQIALPEAPAQRGRLNVKRRQSAFKPA